MTPSRVPPIDAVMVGDCDRSGLDNSPASAFANPKSNTFTVPSAFTFTFAGFRSR